MTAAPDGWTEVQVLVPAGWGELVASTLAEPPCTSVAFGRVSLGSDAPPEGFELLRTFLPARADGEGARAEIAERLGRLAATTGADELAELAPRFRELAPEDYATSWRKVWRPFRLGHLCLTPPGWKGTLRADDVPLVFEPKSSFGTGRHATTRMCLRALQEHGAAGRRVLDAGTGSGLLAVAAARLGAASCLGFDVDPESTPQASALAAANGVAERCEFRAGGFEVLTERDSGFDILLANLYSDLLQDMAPDFARRLAPGGWFVFSGCPAPRRDATRAAFDTAGLRVRAEPRRGRWCAFVGERT
ncbi:MAG: 50S ribosomal protein L11 methyltransferase [Planctomycetota bacterium]